MVFGEVHQGVDSGAPLGQAGAKTLLKEAAHPALEAFHFTEGVPMGIAKSYNGHKQPPPLVFATPKK
jgi:hypothetical protein